MKDRIKFIIKDWADNIKFNGREFDTFEDAWSHIYEYAEGITCEEDYNEFWVDEI